MSDKLETRVIQVTNVAPSCTNEQLRTLFGYLGRVKELKAYPPENTEGAVARVSYIEFDDSVTCGVALHLSGTVFIDRALMVVPVMDGKIPDETTALQLTPQAVAGMLPGQPTWPANVVSQVTGTGINQVITTYDPRLTSLGLPQYPPLPITTDASKIEEIRRTVYVCDLDPKVTAEMLLSFFSQVGEIKYIRLAGDERAGARAAYIEFTDQRSVAQALTYNNVLFQGRTISVQHSKTSVVKPTGKANEASQREIDEAMKKVKEASKLISAAAGETKKDKSHSPSRKRSRSKSKQRSRSRSRSRRSRSRSKGRRRRSRSRTNRRSRSRHRSPRRSRSPRRRRSRSRPRRSRSRERRRSRTRSPVRRRRSRTRSRSRRRSRTPPRSYSKRSQSRSRRSSSRPKRRSRSRDRKEKTKEKKKSVSLSPPRLERNGSIPPRFDDGDKEDSPQKAESSAVTEGESGKASSKKRSPSPVKSRRRSPSPRKRSHSRSPSRRKRRRRTRSPSLRKKSRSRSGSRQRSKRERSKRSRSRDRKRESKKKVVKDKEDKKKDSISSKVKRDYDEEEKGFASGSDRNRDDSEPRSSGSPPPLEPEDKDSDHQPVDMDMSD